MNYNIIAKSYNKLYSEEQIKKFTIIRKLIKIKKGDKLLDIGAGTGIAREYFQECKYTGIEPSEEMIKQSKEKIIKGKAEKLPFKDKTFDIILSVTAIHNFDDYKKSIKEMKRVIKPKGKIVITILKKSSKFEEIRKELIKNFKLEEIEEEKDVIFYNK